MNILLLLLLSCNFYDLVILAFLATSINNHGKNKGVSLDIKVYFGIHKAKLLVQSFEASDIYTIEISFFCKLKHFLFDRGITSREYNERYSYNR